MPDDFYLGTNYNNKDKYYTQIQGGFLVGFWKCFEYIAVIAILAFFVGRLLPKRWFHAEMFPYACYSFERNGKIYDRLHIRKWMNHVPDMSRVFTKLMPAKKMDEHYRDKLPLLIKETCIAEFIHTAECIVGFYCVTIWPGIGGFVIGLLFMLGNLPFIFIQRYNRPRMLKVMKRYCTETDEKEPEKVYAHIDTEL